MSLIIGQTDSGGQAQAFQITVIIDAALEGDVTDRAAIWHFGGEDFNRTISTVAIDEGLMYAADLNGYLYCVEACTGDLVWTHDTIAALWSSPLVADEKVYMGDEDLDVVVLKTGRRKEQLFDQIWELRFLGLPWRKTGRSALPQGQRYSHCSLADVVVLSEVWISKETFK